MEDEDSMQPAGDESIPTIIPQANEGAASADEQQEGAPEQSHGEEQGQNSVSSADFQDGEGNIDINEAEMEAEGAEGSTDEKFTDEGDGDMADGSGDGGIGDTNEAQEENDAAPPFKKKRLCRTPGCNRVIKSQGHCQRHGAKAKRCKIAGCDKQAQGTHDGMCKRHWKAVHFPEAVAASTPKEEAVPPPPEGSSVYDGILPQSIAYRPTMLQKQQLEESNKVNRTENPPPPPGEVNIMPLVTFLRDGSGKEYGWHRNAERRARGMFPCTALSSQLEPWERQLCLVEILLLSGGTPYANFKDLAHAWGRERGFHINLTSNVCERRGEVERRRRADFGKRLTADQREALRQKIQRTRSIERAVASMSGNPIPDNQGMPIEAQAQVEQHQQEHAMAMEDGVVNVRTVVDL